MSLKTSSVDATPSGWDVGSAKNFSLPFARSKSSPGREGYFELLAAAVASWFVAAAMSFGDGGPETSDGMQVELIKNVRLMIRMRLEWKGNRKGRRLGYVGVRRLSIFVS